MAKETIYVNGFLIRQKDFDNGGSCLKVSIKLDEFVTQASNYLKEGWVNIEIGERRNPSPKGLTHYAKVDNYSPKNQSGGEDKEAEDYFSGDDSPFEN